MYAVTGMRRVVRGLELGRAACMAVGMRTAARRGYSQQKEGNRRRRREGDAWFRIIRQFYGHSPRNEGTELKKVRQRFPVSPRPTVAKPMEQAPWTRVETNITCSICSFASPALLCYHVSSCSMGIPDFHWSICCSPTRLLLHGHGVCFCSIEGLNVQSDIYSLEILLTFTGFASSDARSSLY